MRTHLIGHATVPRNVIPIVLVIVHVLLVNLPMGSVVFAQDLALNSKAAILIDYQTGRTLFQFNEHMPLPPASVTKVMTLVLALEAIESGEATPDELVLTSAYAASMGGTQIWLEPGEEMPLKEMIQAIAVGSANDAAVAVAEHLGGSEKAFVDQMNARAKQLGAKVTDFQNPSGLPPTMTGHGGEHVTSAYDLAMISRHALELPDFLELSSTWGPVVMRPDTQQKPVLWSYNNLLKTYPGMDGIKTGMTNDAGFCLSATAMRNNIRLIAVTLGAPTRQARDEDIRRLLDYGFSRLKAVSVIEEGMHVTDAKVLKGTVKHVPLVAQESLYLSMEKDDQTEPERIVEYVRTPTAPIKQGETVAHLITYLEGEEVGRTPLITTVDVARASFFQIVGEYFYSIVSLI